MTFHGVAVEGSKQAKQWESVCAGGGGGLPLSTRFVVRVFRANRKVGHVVDFVVKGTPARGLKGIKSKRQ